MKYFIVSQVLIYIILCFLFQSSEIDALFSIPFLLLISTTAYETLRIKTLKLNDNLLTVFFICLIENFLVSFFGFVFTIAMFWSGSIPNYLGLIIYFLCFFISSQFVKYLFFLAFFYDLQFSEKLKLTLKISSGSFLLFIIYCLFFSTGNFISF